MPQRAYYRYPLPGMENLHCTGKLIVLEGPDGVGRSTQIALLTEWLEAQGYAVYSSGLKRSELAAQGIATAKQGHTLGHLTMALFYTADFADRLERNIIPALQAGFVVLTDHYIYSVMARAMVRGVDVEWLRDIMGIALVPDAIFYLRTDIDHLLPRVLGTRGFDFWESGMDFMGSSDYYESYVAYQQRMLEAFDALGHEYGFRNIDATRGVHEVFTDLCQSIIELVRPLKLDLALNPSPPQS